MNRKSFNAVLVLIVVGTGTVLGAVDLEDDIQRHRTGLITIQTTPHAVVQVKQQRHAFGFGCALSGRVFEGQGNPADEQIYKEKFLELFNCAVTDNALKWRKMEPVQGQVNFLVVDRTLAWADKHKLPLRGHNIFWGVTRFVPDWVRELDDRALYQTVQMRARTVAGRYKDRFWEYDLNNEMIHGNYFEERLGPDITLKMARWIKEVDPNAMLYLNDYDILTGRRLDDYVKHIKQLLAQGVPIAGIGVQGHLHSDTFDAQALKTALDVLAQFKLPIRVTEFNMPGQRSPYYKDRSLRLTPEAEELKARNLVDYYRHCFAHPAVESILMWGFWEGANWIPVSSLYKKDWTPTPAVQAYRDLIYGTWWTNYRGQADENGLCKVRAFYGTHEVVVKGQRRSITLKREEGVVKIVLP